MVDRGVDALLFDVGNVIVEIDFMRTIAHWAAASGQPAALVRERFAFDDAYERHERGEIGASEYFSALRDSLGVALSDEQLETGWNKVFVDEIEGVRGVLDGARGRLPLHAFSNTNATHYREWWNRFSALFSAFDNVFVSCEIGHRKPELAAFRHVARAMGTPTERILFFDDSAENVDGARAAGMQAVHVRSLDDVRAALAGPLGHS